MASCIRHSFDGHDWLASSTRPPTDVVRILSRAGLARERPSGFGSAAGDGPGRLLVDGYDEDARTGVVRKGTSLHCPPAHALQCGCRSAAGPCCLRSASRLEQPSIRLAPRRIIHIPLPWMLTCCIVHDDPETPLRLQRASLLLLVTPGAGHMKWCCLSCVLLMEWLVFPGRGSAEHRQGMPPPPAASSKPPEFKMPPPVSTMVTTGPPGLPSGGPSLQAGQASGHGHGAIPGSAAAAQTTVQQS
jgi:hypothetical protein